MKRFFLWSIPVVALGLLAAIFGFRLWLLSYLRSDECREMVSSAASRVFKGDAAFTLLQADSLDSVYTDSFTVRNAPGVRLIQADQLRADIRFGFFERSCTVEGLEIARLRLIAGNPENTAPLPPGLSTADAPARKGSFTLKRAHVRLLEVGWQGGAVTGSSVVLTPSPEGEWLADGQGGVFRPTLGPSWNIDTFKGRQRQSGFHLTQAHLRSGAKGTARVEGVFGGEAPRSRVDFEGVDLAELLPGDWRARIIGTLGGELEFIGKGAGMSFSQGRFTISDGEVATLPLLDLVARLTRIDGFRKMRLHKASARATQRDGVLEVKDFVVESTGLLRLEGAFTVREGKIAGMLQVGVSENALRWLPGAKETLFTTTRDGYQWTPVKLSGLAAHPQEDLSTRLAAVAISGTVEKVSDAVETVRDAVQENTKGVIDLLTPLVPLPLPKRE